MPSIDLLDKFIIDRRRGLPLHVQIQRALRKMIETRYDDGDAFFTEMEIVEQLGVSRATVRQALGELSREGVLVRRPSVGTVVRKKAVAPRELVTDQSQDQSQLCCIGVFIPDYDSEMTAMLLQQIVEEGRLRRQIVQVYYTHRGEDLQRAYRQIHRAPDQERFILYLPSDATQELSEALWDRGYRTVSLEVPSRDYLGDVVQTNARIAVEMGIDYLRSLGHERITLLVNEPARILSVQDKITHFRRTLPEGRIVTCGTDYWESSYAAAYSHMSEVWESAPTAIMTASDPGAWAALRWLSEHGINVPRQVSVLGFEDARSSRFMHPTLSTIAHPFAALARTALDVLGQESLGGREHRLPPDLIIRESTGPLRARSIP